MILLSRNLESVLLLSRASETFHIEPGRHVRGQKHRERIIRKTRSKSGGRPSLSALWEKGRHSSHRACGEEHWPSSEEDQRNLQDYLWDNAFTHVPLRARNSAGSNWKYHLYTKKEMTLFNVLAGWMIQLIKSFSE